MKLESSMLHLQICLSDFRHTLSNAWDISISLVWKVHHLSLVAQPGIWLSDLQKCNNDWNKYFKSLRLINSLLISATISATSAPQRETI